MPTKPKVQTLSANSAQVLNAIRNNASTNYQDYVPEAVYGDEDNLKAIGNTIMQYPDLQNEFLKNLWNRIGKVVVTSKMYQNPLAMFKKGMLDFGESVEEIFVNPADVKDFRTMDQEANPFKRVTPDVRAAYHIINFEKQYQQTIDQKQLRRAFLSWNGVDDLIAKMTDAIYTGANYDEFLITKYLLAVKTLNGQLEPVQVEAGNTKDALEDNSAIMRATSNDLTFLSNKHNLAGVYTHTDRNDQYVLLNTKYSAYMDVKTLAGAFNMDKADFLGHQVLLNGFDDLDGTDPDARINRLMKNQTSDGYIDGYKPLTRAEVQALDEIPAFLVDVDFFQLYDQYNEFSEERNNRMLYWNYFYNRFSIISSSPFANAIAFVPEAQTVTSVTINPATATINAGQTVQFSTSVETTGFASQAVTYTLTGDGADKAQISSSGLLSTAPDATGTITVTATSVADPTKTAEAEVTIAV